MMKLLRICACIVSLGALSAQATIVRFETSLGDFDVNLYDDQTPLTVANFLGYVDRGDYDGTFFHRSVPGFIVQGGGFSYGGLNAQNNWTADGVNEQAPVDNEPVFSNVRGTIAMAKLGGYPNSATSQWFFNLANNAPNLDAQNGGFTVFGEVVEGGMPVINNIAALDIFNFGGVMSDLPLRNYSQQDIDAGTQPDSDFLVEINRITVIDASADTAADLNPPLTTFTPSNGGGSGGDNSSGGGGGGSTGSVLLAVLFSIWLFRRKRQA